MRGRKAGYRPGFRGGRGGFRRGRDDEDREDGFRGNRGEDSSRILSGNRGRGRY